MTEDFKKWGDAWIYCDQHCRVHKTGWCTVPIQNKTFICNGDIPEEGANKKWEEINADRK